MASTPDGLKNLVQGTYWLALWHNTTPAIWVMLAISLWALWRRRRNLKMSEVLLLLIPLIYFLLLLFAPTGDLRFLPVVGFTYAFAVAGAAWSAELISGAGEEVRGWLLPALLSVCLAACFFEFCAGIPITLHSLGTNGSKCCHGWMAICGLGAKSSQIRPCFSQNFWRRQNRNIDLIY